MIDEEIKTSEWKPTVAPITKKVKESRLRWFEHVCRNMEDYLVMHIWERKEEGRRGCGLPAKRRMDCVMKDLWQTGMTVEECRRVVLDRER